MSNDAFDVQILSEKLSKLNNSQQSIESLSRWCISHRKRAKQIVETWNKQFSSSQKERRVSFLYLANDILQNSRRKGNEFVNEFWKVLPAALKVVYEADDEHGKKAVTRLVDIWEERKVFGSRCHSLNEMLGKNPPAAASNNKSSNPIKIQKRDAHSVRIKLAIGDLPEKIVTAFQTVLDDHFKEESALNKFDSTVHHLNKIQEDVERAPPQGNPESSLLDDMQQLEQALHQCLGQLESAESARVALINQLKEALREQESKVELIRGKLQTGRSQVERISNIRKILSSEPTSVPALTAMITAPEAAKVPENNLPSLHPTSAPPRSSLSQPIVSFTPSRPTEEESKRAAAAAVAAKLAASTSSAQMLTSVLSSLVAEEAASLNGNFSLFPAEKRQKLDNPMPELVSSDPGNSGYFNPVQQPPRMQSLSQGNLIQAGFNPAPPPPPPPSVSSGAPPVSQYSPSTGMMVGLMPYAFGANNNLPPPPPLPPHIAMSLSRPPTQPLQPPQTQPQATQQQQQQQPPTSGGFYRPPGIGFYGQNHQPSTPPVPRT